MRKNLGSSKKGIKFAGKMIIYGRLSDGVPSFIRTHNNFLLINFFTNKLKTKQV